MHRTKTYQMVELRFTQDRELSEDRSGKVPLDPNPRSFRGIPEACDNPASLRHNFPSIVSH